MSADSDDKKRTPFIHIKVSCPVCGHQSDQCYLKSKFFQPLDAEKDLHVLNYKWTESEFNYIRPENYYIWHCPGCNFCDEMDVFRDKIDPLWKGRLDFICDKLKKEGRNSSSFLSILGKHIESPYELITTEQALLRHYVACYIQEEFLTPNNRMAHKLSRFFLRLAWLYRERETFGADESAVPNGYLSFKEFFSSLTDLWPNIPQNEHDALARALVYYTELLNQSGKEDDIKKEVTLMFLLLQLHAKIGEHETAYGYVRSIFSSCMKRRQVAKSALDKGVSSGQINQQQIEQLKGLVNWLSISIEQASAEGDAINELIFWSEYERAREAAMQLNPMAPKAVLDKLRELQFKEITCRKVASLCRPPAGKKFITELPALEELREKEKFASVKAAAASAEDSEVVNETSSGESQN